MKIFILLLFVTFFKELVWQVVLPIWQTPDEQAHFAQLQWYAEKKTLTIDPNLNLSQEVATSEEILGTRRDKFGNNQYTYHPEYKNTSKIPDFPKNFRTTYVDQEAAGYPPLYYLISLPFYNLFYNSGLIDRLFAVRLISLIFHLGTIFIAYKIGKLPLATLVSFHPMLSFVAAGFHPDNLLIFLYSLEIYICLCLLKKFEFKKLFWAGLVFVLGYYTKPLMLLVAPLIVFSILPNIFGLFALLVPILVIFSPIQIASFTSVVTPASPLANLTFRDYLHFRLGKLFFEIWPWYWGVFKWLGVTLPPLVMKVITRVALICSLGLIRARSKILLFFMLSSASYLVYLLVWDYRLMQSVGFSQGLQGRYLFPNVIPHMAIFLAGWQAISKKTWWMAILPAGMIILNLIAFYTVANSYYDLSSVHTFLIQLSQNKPGIIKILVSRLI